MNLILTPEVLLTGWIVLLMLVLCFKSEICSTCLTKLAMIGVAVVLISTWVVAPCVPEAWGSLYSIDPLAIFFKRFFLLTALVVLWMGGKFMPQMAYSKQEFAIVPLVPLLGMMLMASATDFIMLFVALELVTISFYILVAYQRNVPASLEAGAKYLVVGALATGFLVFGIAFLLGVTGETNFAQIALALKGNSSVAVVVFSLILIGVGVGFKVAAVPFHAWVPDVYQGAPTPVTAYLAVASKAAGFLILLRVYYYAGFAVEEYIGAISFFFALLAGASVLLGSFAALPQSNLKRLLGYSSIANAGFLLMGLSCMSDRGADSVIIYLIVYSLATLLAFFIIVALHDKLGGDDLRHYAGLSQKSPLMALALSIAFVSLAGIPPLVGFFGKISVFAAVWQSGQYALLAVGVIAAIAGLYYYLKIVRSMYWIEPVELAPVEVCPATKALAVIMAALIIVLGVWQAPLSCIVKSSYPDSASECTIGSPASCPVVSGACQKSPSSTCPASEPATCPMKSGSKTPSIP